MKLRNLFLILGALVVIGLMTLDATKARAQAGFFLGKGVVCAATGSSTQVFAANAARESYVLMNDSGLVVRVGALVGGTATLDDTNSVTISAGGSLADTVPGIFVGRINCMSNTGATATIHVIETRRK